MVAIPEPRRVTRPVLSTDATDGESLPHVAPLTGCVPPLLIAAVAANVSDAPIKIRSDEDVTVTDCTMGVGAAGVPPSPPHAAELKVASVARRTIVGRQGCVCMPP